MTKPRSQKAGKTRRQKEASHVAPKAKRATSAHVSVSGKREPEEHDSGKENSEGGEDVPLSRQERFCRLVACEYKTPFEAYTEAFEWGKTGGLPRQAMNAADALMQIPEIINRIEELQPFQIEPPLGEDMLTLGEHLRELSQLEKIAVRQGQIGAAVQAAIHRGKASGLYVERSISAHVTLEQLIAASRKDGRIEYEQGGQKKTIDDTKHGSGLPKVKGAPTSSGLKQLA